MTTPTPDPLALAEEAIRELEQLAAFAIPHGYVMQFDAISALAAALRAAHEENARLLEENTRLREALGPFAMFAEKWDAKPMYRLHNVLYRIHFGTEWQAELRLSDMRRARQALAGGKGEG